MTSKKWMELIEQNWDSILAEMLEADEASIRYPSCEYRVYIDTDGDTGHEEWAANDNGMFSFKEGYDRCYIHTFCWDGVEILDHISPYDARYEFERDFGYPVEQDCDRNFIEDMEATAAAHGDGEKYAKWIEAQEEETVAWLLDEAKNNGDYRRFLGEFFDELERYAKYEDEEDEEG